MKRKKLPLAFAGAALALSALRPSDSRAAVWPTERHWSPEWENRYAEWVRTSWDKDFFARPGTPYSGLKLDCADVVYSMRIVFAFENRLPFAMKDPTGGKKNISNEMTRFDHLPSPEQRIRPFLNFIYGTASTQSIPNDTVPVAIRRDFVRSGALILTDKESHHSWTIRDIRNTGLPSLIFSSRPAKTTLQVREGQPSLEFTFRGKIDLARHAGFRAFRKLEDLGKPAYASESYSDEQYKIPAREWMSVVKKRLAIVEESPEALLKRTLETACQGARERVASVQEGVDHLAKVGCNRCLDATEYDNYSTPNRDMRLRNSFEELRDGFEGLSAAERSRVPAELLAQVEDVVRDAGRARAPSERTCAIEIAPSGPSAPSPPISKTLSLAEVYKRSIGGRLSDNPHDPLAYRWGEQSGNSARAKRCPKYE